MEQGAKKLGSLGKQARARAAECRVVHYHKMTQQEARAEEENAGQRGGTGIEKRLKFKVFSWLQLRGADIRSLLAECSSFGFGNRSSVSELYDLRLVCLAIGRPITGRSAHPQSLCDPSHSFSVLE